MNRKKENPYEALEKLFHEPNRLAIMSALCASEKTLSFNDVKEECSLTDGNLNRHLKTLEEAGVVRIDKQFVGAKPRTNLSITDKGLRRFSEYLAALSDVLDTARTNVKREKKSSGIILRGKTAEA